MAQRAARRWASPARLARRLVDLLGPTSDAARQSLIALGFNSITSLLAGAMLVALVSSFERYPGLLVLIPAAIGLRGNVFTGLGNRLSTAIHTGTFRLSFRSESILGQNLLASFSLTISMSVALGVLAKIIAVVVGIPNTLGVLQLIGISAVGGLIGSIPVALAAILITLGAVNRGWDLDNLVAPTVSTLGDIATIPALWLAAVTLGDGVPSSIAGGVMLVLAVVLLALIFRDKRERLRQIVKESIPVLMIGLLLSTLAGMVLQKQLTVLAALPAVLALQPAFVSSAGALGGILAGRAATGLHVGSIEPTLVPGREVRRDATFLLGLAAPVFLLNAVGASVVAGLTGILEPSVAWMLLLTFIAGIVTLVFVTGVGYYATIGAWRIEVDPDTYGTPLVTSSVDFAGTVALIATVFALGLA
jgi:mgtE-like transporter